jgi:hypothetical protein
MKKEEKKCPLSLVDWVNYLVQEKNTEYFVFFNAVISNLTIMIIILTILGSVIVLGTSLINFSIITGVEAKNIVIIGTWTVLVFMIIINAYIIFWRIPKVKNRIEKIVKSEEIIIQEILAGEETDIDCILKRFRAIWKNL